MVAIDIGSSSVKIVELSGRGQRKLGCIGLEVFGSNAIADGEIKDADVVADVVSDLLFRLKIKTKGRRAAVSLGGSGILIKRALIQPSNDTDFSEQVFYEAQQLFHHDMDDMYFRYQEVQSRFAPADKKAVILVGAKRELVETHLSILRSVNLKTGIVDCDTLCIANMFEYNYPVVDGLVVIANIGASSTQVILVNRGEFLYTRDIYLGGNAYNQRIMEALSVDFQNAESLKVSAGLGDQSVHGNVIQSISDVNDMLVREIQTTINFFLQNEGGVEPMKPSMVFLTGGGARSLGLDAAIAAGFGIPVQILNPFQRIKLGTTSKHMSLLMTQGPVYSTALGLALREADDTRVE